MHSPAALTHLIVSTLTLSAAVAVVNAQDTGATVPACTNGFQYPSYREASGGLGFPGCPIPPLSYMPPSCYGSNPDDALCSKDGYHLTGADAVDPCKPVSGLITDASGHDRLGSQLAYIKSPTEWCLLFPNTKDPWLNMVYYGVGLRPQSVQAEGLIIAQCQGGYTSSGAGLSAQQIPSGAVLSAQLTTSFDTPGKRYIQMWGLFDPDVVKVQPAASDMGGQYDSSDFVSCGKEPYSGVDPSVNSVWASQAGSTPFNFVNYVQYFGGGEWCIRICEGNSYGTLAEAPCSAQFDTAGCGNWGITSFPSPGVFTGLSASGGSVSTTVNSLTAGTTVGTSPSTTTSSSSTTLGSNSTKTSGPSTTANATTVTITGSGSGKSGAMGAVHGSSSVLLGLGLVLASYFF